MAAPVPLRPDYDAESLRALAKGSRDPAQKCRLLALSVIGVVGTRSEAAAIGGGGLQTVHDWVVAFNTDGQDALIDGKAHEARPRLNAEQCDALRALVERGPPPAPTAWCACAIHDQQQGSERPARGRSGRRGVRRPRRRQAVRRCLPRPSPGHAAGRSIRRRPPAVQTASACSREEGHRCVSEPPQRSTGKTRCVL